MSKRLLCNLCPKHCAIASGESGECRIRINLDGKLIAVTFGYPVAIHIDPIEKKPLFHFLPGSPIFSLATVGCNFHCKNCQNWQISQANPEETDSYLLPPEQITSAIKRSGCRMVAYTYTEPLVYYEYTLACAEQAKNEGIYNVLVSAGYANQEPLRRLFRVIDAANIDLKAMSDSFYRKICSGTLKPVLDCLVLAKTMRVHLEVTNLVIPGLNDSREMILDLVRFVRDQLGPDTPLHFSAFHPEYRLRNIPPTPSETLIMARTLALDQGLDHVYTGNITVPEGQNTYCPFCHELLVERSGFAILKNRLDRTGHCPTCQHRTEGIWSDADFSQR